MGMLLFLFKYNAFLSCVGVFGVVDTLANLKDGLIIGTEIFKGASVVVIDETVEVWTFKT